MAQTRKRAKNTLDVDSPAKLGMMKALMGTGRSGVVSYVLVYAPWCGACRKFRQNIWDPSMRFPARHNRIAIRDDVFNNSPFAKKVPDLKYLPSMILVDEKGDVQTNVAPEGPTNILPTPTSVDQLVKMANVNVKPLPVAAATANAAKQTDQTDAVNEILSKPMNTNNINNNLSKPTNMKNVIANANKTAEIAKNAAAEVKASTVALNNASRDMLAKAIVNTKVAADSAREAAENAKESANSIRNMLGEIKNLVASAKGNANANTNMAAKAAAAAAVAAAAAAAAEEAANEGANAVEEANVNTNVNVNVNTNVNTNGNANAVNYEDWEKEELMDMIPEEEYNNPINTSNFSPPNGMMSKNGSLTTKFPTPPVAPQNYKKPSNMMGGKRATHGKLYKMLVAMNSRTTQRKRQRRRLSKKLTRRAN